MTTQAAVPTIDIAPFLANEPGAREAIGRQVAQTCQQTGFLIISGHGFPADLFDRAKRQLFEFFDLPDEVKNRWHPTGASRQRGFHGFEIGRAHV